MVRLQKQLTLVEIHSQQLDKMTHLHLLLDGVVIVGITQLAITHHHHKLEHLQSHF
jgi:hypothetical protein